MEEYNSIIIYSYYPLIAKITLTIAAAISLCAALVIIIYAEKN